MRQVPKASELQAQAELAKAQGQRAIRFLIPPRKRFLERFPMIWDGVAARTVGRQMESVTLTSGESVMVTEALVCEVNVHSVIEAAGREQKREQWAGMQPMPVNQLQAKRPVIGAR